MVNDVVSELRETLMNWVDHRSPREIEYQKKAEIVHKEEARLATEIAAATQAWDIDALATLLPRREAVALLLQEAKKEEGAVEASPTD